MGHRFLLRFLLLFFTACSPATSLPTSTHSLIPARTPVPPSQIVTFTSSPTETPTATLTHTPSPIPTVPSLKARVTVDGLLSCRYGPGPEYLYLYALRTGANIILIGRVDADNWNWVYVQGEIGCWLNAGYIEIEGDRLSLPNVYPGSARLPVTRYYPPTTVLSASRIANEVSVSWLDIPLRPGDEEDEFMLHYIVEVWHCMAGGLRFEPLATNEPSISFSDEPGCVQPSHGRIFVQEKHGFAGPTEIPWPPYNR